MPIDPPVEKSDVQWVRYKDSSLVLSDHYYQFGIVLAITSELLENRHEADLAARVSVRSFRLHDKMFCINSSEERMRFSSDLRTHTHTAWMLLKAMVALPLDLIEPNLCLHNKNRPEEVYWPAPLSTTEAPYLYPWTSKKGFLPSKFEFQTYVTTGEIFSWSLEGTLLELDARVPILKRSMPLKKGQVISAITSHSLDPNEAFLFKSLWQFAAFIVNSSPPAGTINLVYHMPCCDHMLLGVGLFVSNKMTLEALGSFFKCVLDKRTRHLDFIDNIFEASDLKPRLNITIESPFVSVFGPIDALLEKAHWDNTLQNTTELALYILSQLGIPSVIPQEESAQYERLLLKTCKQRLLTRDEHAERRAFNQALYHTWVDYGLDDIDTLEDLLKIGRALTFAASARGKESIHTCSWLPLSEQNNALLYDSARTRLNRTQRAVADAEPTYPSIMNVVLLEPAIHSPINPSGLMSRCRESFKSHFVKLIDHKGLLDTAVKNADSASEMESYSVSLTKVFSLKTQPLSIGFFEHPAHDRTRWDSALNLITQRPIKRIPFMDFHDFFPWIAVERAEEPIRMNSKDKVRFLLQMSKKEFLNPYHFKSPQEFNQERVPERGDDGLRYQRLTATFHKAHINAMHAVLDAKKSKKSPLFFDTTTFLHISLMMLAMIPDEYACRRHFLDHILKNPKDLVAQTLTSLIDDDHLTVEETIELTEELLQATSKLTPFSKLLFDHESGFSLNLFMRFCTLALERSLPKIAAALRVIYEQGLVSAPTLVEMIKKIPEFHWRVLIVSMLAGYPDELRKALLFRTLDEFDEETLLRDLDFYLQANDEASPVDKAMLIEEQIKPFKAYVMAVRSLSTDELAVLNNYFLNQQDSSLDHLPVEHIRDLAQGLADKNIISSDELDGMGGAFDLVIGL